METNGETVSRFLNEREIGMHMKVFMKNVSAFAAAFVFVLAFGVCARSQEVSESDVCVSAQSADGWSSPDKAGARMEIEIEGVKTAFRWCPPGSFTRHWSKGTESYWEEPVNQFDEEADYTITLTQGFWFAETETTQELWKAVMGKNLGWIARTDNIPMGLSWEGMQEFISKLNDGGYAPNGFEFRLPTEAQWEYACMAGTTGERYGELDAIAWHEGNARGSQNEVGQKEPNAWGLYDMLGNAWEWCSDWYGRYPNRDLTDYAGPQKGSLHVVRGGWGFPGWAPAGWVTSVENCSRTCRGAKDQGVVRLVLVPEGQKSSQNALALEVVESAENDEASAPDAVASDSNATDWTSPGKAGARMEVEINGVKAAFRWCPPGNLARRWSKGTERFWEKQTDWDDDKQDFDVALTQGFWLAETETTQELWKAVTGNNPSLEERTRKRPVNNVSWDDAQEFISKLNDGGYAPAGFEFRLPTEAQWEYACMAGTAGERYGELDAIAWYEGNTGVGDIANEVGLKKPNAWGLYDMLGNIEEWCYDRYEKYPMKVLTDYIGPQEGSYHVVRGCCCDNSPAVCKRSFRAFLADKSIGGCYIGFRLALVPKEE